mmetsp:Transcript_4542/g.5095  ORF Transcript_4542/g.5095 Transcript_4542/m.5095 type:complete len:140 (+) Transcript_4542:645-1064(+)
MLWVGSSVVVNCVVVDGGDIDVADGDVVDGCCSVFPSSFIYCITCLYTCNYTCSCNCSCSFLTSTFHSTSPRKQYEWYNLHSCRSPKNPSPRLSNHCSSHPILTPFQQRNKETKEKAFPILAATASCPIHDAQSSCGNE